MKNKVNINGVEIEKIIENPQHLGGLVSKFNELLDALDEKEEERCDVKHTCGKEERHDCYCGGDCKHVKEEPKRGILPACKNCYLSPDDNFPCNDEDCKYYMKEEPKSTLREEIKKIYNTNELMGDDASREIISLFKDILLKEIAAKQAEKYIQRDSELLQTFTNTKIEIINLIKNL